MQEPNHHIQGDFYTSATLGTLAGAAGAVYLICGALQKAFNFNPKWLALVLSLFFSVTGALITQTTGENTFNRMVIALLNGFLIYATATGTNQLGASVPNKKYRLKHIQKQPLQKRQFTTRWWPD